jgi:hypothetical protein
MPEEIIVAGMDRFDNYLLTGASIGCDPSLTMGGSGSGALLLLDEASRVYVVPGNPGPERSPNGSPTMSLIGSGQEGYLQVGVRWWPEPEELATLTDSVARALGRDVAELVLSGEAVSVSRVSLLLGDSRSPGSPTELVTSQSSGMAPFNAVFSAPVEGAQLDLARQALAGVRGLLRVRLEGAIAAGAPYSTTILSAPIDRSLRDLIAAVADVVALESWIARGAVTRTRFELGSVAPEARRQADERAAQGFLRDAATALATGPAGLEYSANAAPVVHALGSVPLQSAQPIVCEADVAGWVSPSGGPAVFLLSANENADSASPAPTTAASRSVSLAFRPAGSPLKGIDVAAGPAQARLEPPFEKPAFLATDAPALHVTSRFADGPAYEHEVARAGESWTLTPADLGLVEIHVEATESAAPASLEIDAFYQPSDRGSADRRSFHLPDATGKWSSSWFVASRAPELAGELVLTVTREGEDGQKLPPRTIHAKGPTVRV